MSHILLAFSRLIDAVTGFIGHHVRWLILAAVLVSAANAILRKAFDISSNAWLELQWLLFGAVFMLAAADVLQKNAHVRIDVLSGPAKLLVLAGALLLFLQMMSEVIKRGAILAGIITDPTVQPEDEHTSAAADHPE